MHWRSTHKLLLLEVIFVAHEKTLKKLFFSGFLTSLQLFTSVSLLVASFYNEIERHFTHQMSYRNKIQLLKYFSSCLVYKNSSMTVKHGFCLGFPPFSAGFRPWGIGIQVVKTTSALIAMSSSCISTFLVKHRNLGKKC